MLRISIHEPAEHAASLHLEGQIAGAWTAELDKVCARLLAEGRRLTLDLADVTLIDRPGITLLAALVRGGVELVRCSPFQHEQLRLATTRPAEAPPSIDCHECTRTC
jgi:ABC-type transporter Mla MlaB component